MKARGQAQFETEIGRQIFYHLLGYLVTFALFFHITCLFLFFPLANLASRHSLPCSGVSLSRKT